MPPVAKVFPLVASALSLGSPSHLSIIIPMSTLLIRKHAVNECILICLLILVLSESKWKWSEVKVAQSCPILCDPMDYMVYGILQARILEWVAVPFARGSSNWGMEPRSPAAQAGSSPAELPGKPTSPQRTVSNGILVCSLAELAATSHLHWAHRLWSYQPKPSLWALKVEIWTQTFVTL